MKLRELQTTTLLQELPAWGISLLINLAILIPLHFIVHEARSEPEPVSITSIMDSLEEVSPQFSATISDQVGNLGNLRGGGGGGPSENAATDAATTAVAGV